jgi:hypothetical protein
MFASGGAWSNWPLLEREDLGVKRGESFNVARDVQKTRLESQDVHNADHLASNDNWRET